MIIDEEVICPECGASLAIHCDVEAERAKLREENEALRDFLAILLDSDVVVKYGWVKHQIDALLRTKGDPK